MPERFKKFEGLHLPQSAAQGTLILIYRMRIYQDQPEIGYHIVDSFLKGKPLWSIVFVI